MRLALSAQAPIAVLEFLEHELGFLGGLPLGIFLEVCLDLAKDGCFHKYGVFLVNVLY